MTTMVIEQKRIPVLVRSGAREPLLAEVMETARHLEQVAPVVVYERIKVYETEQKQ